MRERISMPLLESNPTFHRILKTFGEVLKAEVEKIPNQSVQCKFMLAADHARTKVEYLLKELVDEGALVFAPRFEIGILPHSHDNNGYPKDIFIFKVETGEMFEALGITNRGLIYVENHSQYMQ